MRLNERRLSQAPFKGIFLKSMGNVSRETAGLLGARRLQEVQLMQAMERVLQQ